MNRFNLSKVHQAVFHSLSSQLVLLGVAIAFCGCGQSSHSLAKVTGRVTKAGKPVAGASIAYQPMASSAKTNAGPGSFGVTNDDGVYTLKTIRGEQEGAVVGRHRITVALHVPGGATEDGVVDPAFLAPIVFRDGSTQLDVPPEGLVDANFDLGR